MHERDLADRRRPRRRPASARRAGSRGRGSRSRSRALAPPPRRPSRALSAVETASGFSQTTWTPRSIAASACAAWTSFGVQTWRTSTYSRVEQLAEIAVRRAHAEAPRPVPRAAADGDDLDADRLQRDRVHARDEAGADDRRAHQREARNICVSTSMSSRAPSGGVRHGVAVGDARVEVPQLARERLVVGRSTIRTRRRVPSRRDCGDTPSGAASATARGTRACAPPRRT